MDGFGSEGILLQSWFVIGLVMVLLLLAWRLHRNQAQVCADIIQLKRIIDDLISINERNLAGIRSELGRAQQPSQSGAAAVRTLEIAERKKHIWNLADKGLSAEEITRRINIPRGQVDLLLNMRNHSGSNGLH